MATLEQDRTRTGRDHGILGRTYRRLTFGIVSVILIVAFESMAVGTAMPVAVRDLGGLPLYALAFSAYFTASLLAMVVSGEVCDARGPKLPLYGGVVCFAAGLLLSGTAVSMLPFVLGRAVQGFGGGLVIVSLYVVVSRAYPVDLRPRVFSAFAAAWVLPSVVGPPVAGAVTDHAGWRWVFLGIPVLVALPMLVMFPQLRRMPDPPPEERTPVDRRRILAATGTAAGAGLLQYGGQHPTVAGVVMLVAGAALMVPTVPRLLPEGTLRAARGLPSVILMRGLAAGAFFAVDSFIPLMLISVHGYSPTLAGLMLTTAALTWAAGSTIQSRTSSRRRPGLVRIGFVLLALGVAGAVLSVLPHFPAWTVGIGWALAGVGMGLATSAVGVLTLDLSAPEDAGVNSASLQVCDSLGTIVMVGLGGSLFATMHHGSGHDAPVFRIIFLIMLGVALLGALLAPRVRPAASLRGAAADVG